MALRASSLLLLPLVLVLGGSFSAQADTLKLGVPSSPDEVTDTFITRIVTAEEFRKNDINVEPLSIEQPGEVINYLRKGVYDVAFVSLDVLVEYRMKWTLLHTQLLGSPLIFSSSREQFAAQDSIFGDVVLAEVGQTGVLPLAFWNRAPTKLVLTREVRGAEDLKGLKIHSSGAMNIALLRAFGAVPVVSPSAEIYTALQNGVLDAVEAPQTDFGMAVATKVGHTVLTNYRASTGFVVTSQPTWESFSERKRQTIHAVLERLEAGVREMIENEEEESLSALRQRGLQIVSFPTLVRADDVRQAWIEQTGPEGQSAWDLLERTRLQYSAPPTPPKRSHATPSPEDPAPVFFTTDRKDELDSEFRYRFGLRQFPPATISCGRVEYQPGIQRRLGETYGGRVWFSAEPIVDLSECSKYLGRAASKFNGRIIVFIHGYWNSFDNSIRRAIAIAQDLEIDAPLVAWCWPSLNELGGYHYDEDSIEWSRPHFVDFLDALASRPEVTVIDLLTHSMGSRLGIIGLDAFADTRDQLDYAIFVAPDVDASTFRQAVFAFTDVGELKTLYASEVDRALQISRKIHRETRAGLGGANLIVMEGLESIDATEVESSIRDYFELNHSHAFDVPEAVMDLQELLHNRAPARDRRLKQMERDGLAYWLIQRMS